VKNLLLSVLLAVFLSPAYAHAESGWITDYKRAQEEAKASHKLLLLNFTGSDWCGYCIQLDRAILSQPLFKPQSIEVRKQNAELAERYQIEGFPTLVVLNGDGKTLWRYDGLYTGDIAEFLAELDKARKG